jgi:hypothetical protein
MYGLCMKCLNENKIDEYNVFIYDPIFDIDINIFKYNENIKEDDRLKKIIEYMNNERIDNNIRNKSAYNLCKVFECNFITRYNFCRNHIHYEKKENILN